MTRANPLVSEVVATLAQALLFLVGLTLSIIVGMGLAGLFDGPGWLLIATGVAGSGLLGSAVLSQTLRDYLVRGDD